MVGTGAMNALKALTQMNDLFSLTQKLSRFRRHPDWKAAFKKVALLFTVDLPDGQRGVHERDITTLFELADEQFFVDIIKREGPT